MVDTGAKGAFISLYRALSLLGVNGLDGVFLTHTHADHIGGMEALSRRCGIGALYSAEISMDKDDGKNAIDQLAGELGLEQVKLRAGDTVDIGSGAYFEVLGPLETNSEDDNDNSLVMKLHAGGITVLLAGDMQFAEEQTLLDAGADLSADVLKVGNHGNPDATSEAFAKAVGADYAVISTSAAQEPDTPADSVIAALGSARIAVTQDDACGVLLGATGGAVVFYDPAIPAAAADIAIAQIDTEAQTVSLVNNGGDADISGYFIVSEKGNEVFVFPQGAALAAGETITVACTGGTGDYIWDDKKVWSGKDSEAGALYDAYGNALSRMQPSRLHNIWVRP
jgi:competence protein ComEC